MSRNSKLQDVLSSRIDLFIKSIGKGFSLSSAMYCHSGIDELGEQGNETHNIIQWCDKDSDIGTYQFWLDGNKIVVADYLDEAHVYGQYSRDEFDLLFDVGLCFDELKFILDVMVEHNAYCFLELDSEYLNHKELMARTGWYDKRITKYFPNVVHDEHDREKYYPLTRILEIEQSL